MQFGKWILIAIGAYIAWRFLNGWLGSQTSYNVQSSNYVQPFYPQAAYGQVGDGRYGFVGYGGGWNIPNGNWSGDGWNSNGDWVGHHTRTRTPRVGTPGGSTRW